MSLQFDTAFRVLSDYFGFPKWEENPKSGQSRNEIVRLWEEELSGYSADQVKSACYEVCRYAKSMTFPTISHVMARLCDKERLEDPEFKNVNVVRGTSPEKELWEMTGKQYLFGSVKQAFRKMVKDYTVLYPELANADVTTICDNMRRSGWWNTRIGEYVEV